MPGSKFLSCRCVISTFLSNASPLLDNLPEETKSILRDANVLPLFYMPTLQQNIPLLYVLLKSYCWEKKSFLIGTKCIKMSVNDIALILGLPNRGMVFEFERSPFSERTHKDIVIDIRTMAGNDSMNDNYRGIADLLVKYLLCVFLFPLKGLQIPRCLDVLEGVDSFKLYNWPLAIHCFLHAQFDHLSRVSAFRDAGTNIGYLEGCSVVLLIWFFEHTNLQLPFDDLARPRICRWSPTASYSAKCCSNLNYTLRRSHQYMKSCNFRGSHKLVSHITLSKIETTELLLMPVHENSHWTLLVCKLKEKAWDFYDSLASVRHRSSLSDKMTLWKLCR